MKKKWYFCRMTLQLFFVIMVWIDQKADLICETKYKNYVYYELNISAVEDIMLWLADLKGEV